MKTARSSRKSRAEPAVWLDELWSLANADAVSSPLEVLTGVHSDNNHYLYTLYLLAIGDSLSPGP